MPKKHKTFPHLLSIWYRWVTYIKQSALEMTTYNVDHLNTHLPHKDVVLPEPVVKLLEELAIGPKKLVPVFDSFMNSVLAFNAKCTDLLMHY